MSEMDYVDYIKLNSIANRHEENEHDDLYQNGGKCGKILGVGIVA